MVRGLLVRVDRRAVKMLRLRSRVIQLSGDWLSRQPLTTSGRVCPAAVATQRRYASAENVDYKPIKKLLVANRGNGDTVYLSVAFV